MILKKEKPNLFGSLDIEIWDLPFDYAQGGEHVEPFVIWCLEFGIYKFDIPRSFFSGKANELWPCPEGKDFYDGLNEMDVGNY